MEIKCQLDATEVLLQILLLAQHVSGTIMLIIRSSRVLYSGCCLWYLVLWFSSCWSGVERRVMCPDTQQFCTSKLILWSEFHRALCINYLLKCNAICKTARITITEKLSFNYFSLNYENNNYQADSRCQLPAGTPLHFGASLLLTASILLLFEVQLVAPRNGDLSKELAPTHLVNTLFAVYETK